MTNILAFRSYGKEHFRVSPCPAPELAGPAPSFAAPPAISADRAVTCFTPGTLINTRDGKIAVERLKQDDMILTRDRGFQPLIWKGVRTVDFSAPDHDPDARPVLIRAGALGDGQPERDMLVSPWHRMLCTDRDTMQWLGEPEALIEARSLIGRAGVERARTASVTYVHLLMDQHEVVLSNNTWSESFRLSGAAARALADAGCADIEAHFSDLLDGDVTSGQTPARLCPSLEDIKVDGVA